MTNKNNREQPVEPEKPVAEATKKPLNIDPWRLLFGTKDHFTPWRVVLGTAIVLIGVVCLVHIGWLYLA